MPGSASAFYRLLIPAIVLLPTWLFPGRRQKLSLRSYAIIAVGLTLIFGVMRVHRYRWIFLCARSRVL